MQQPKPTHPCSPASPARWRRTGTAALTVLALWAGGGTTAQAAASAYRFVDLGTLGGLFSRAEGINDAGQVVGASMLGDQWHPTLWHNGQIIDLDPSGGSFIGATDINNAALMVGTSGLGATLWRGLQATALSGLGPAGASVNSINNVGQSAGMAAVDAAGTTHAVLWNGTSAPIDLGTLGGRSSVARGINDHGQVAGDSDLADGTFSGAVWSSGLVFKLNGLGGSSSATAINDVGQVVGYSWGGGQGHAVLWDNSATATDLGTLGGAGSEAFDINNKGQIVGRSEVLDDVFVHGHATLWEGHSAIDLNDYMPADSVWTLRDATAINEQGWITGLAVYNEAPRMGVQHAFVLMPVPEPGTSALMLLGLVAMGGAARLRGRRPTHPTAMEPAAGLPRP